MCIRDRLSKLPNIACVTALSFEDISKIGPTLSMESFSSSLASVLDLWGFKMRSFDTFRPTIGGIIEKIHETLSVCNLSSYVI